MVGAAHSSIGFAQETARWRQLPTMHRMHDVYVNVNANPSHLRHEPTRTPDPLPAGRRAPFRGQLHRDRAGSPLDSHGSSLRTGSHQSVAAARPTTGRWRCHAGRVDRGGLLHWQCERWDVRLWISATDYNVARVAVYDPQGFGGEAGADFYALHGAQDPSFLAHVRGRASYFPTLVPALPPRFRRIMDGDTLDIGGRAWRCISGYGHAPEHMALFCAELTTLISGDMVLPRISTNVSVHASEPEANPLQLFLTSLLRYLDLPESTLVLPSHGKPFIGLATRIAQLQNHHRERLAEISLAAHDHALSPADSLPILFQRKLDTHQMTFAMGEALAHLHHLWMDGKLERFLDQAGVQRFRAPNGG